jgi:hypothetical protein
MKIMEEHRLRVFENRVLRRIFGPKRDEVKGGRRKLYNEELHNVYSSPSIIRMIRSRRMRWIGYVARMGRSAYIWVLINLWLFLFSIFLFAAQPKHFSWMG